MKMDSTTPVAAELPEILAALGRRSEAVSLGPDIDSANTELLDPTIDPERKKARFRQWARRHQPCLFGRLGAKGAAGVHYDICWIDRASLCRGTQGACRTDSSSCSTRRSWRLHGQARSSWRPAVSCAICS